MRKTLKSALSVVLSAAMVLTMGSVGSLTNNKSAKAADTVPDFTIKIAQNGNLWGWGEDLVKGDQVSLDIKDFGTYTLSADVPADSDDINSLGNALWIDTTLTDVPTDYDIVAKTVKVNDTEYDWSKTHAYKDGDTVRLGVVNGWAADSEEANPLAGQKVAVKTGDKLTFTFEVKSNSGDASADPTEAPSEEPSTAPDDATEAPSEVPADPTTAPSSEYVATASYADGSAIYYWGASDRDGVEETAANVVLEEGDKDYTVTIKNTSGAAAAGLAVLRIDIPEFTTALEAKGLQATVKNIAVKADGADVAVDTSKMAAGNLEDKGGYEIELFNSWGGKSSEAVSPDSLKFSDTIEISFTLNIAAATAQPTDPVTPPTEGKLDFNATIKCYGNFYGWDSDTPTDATATVHVSDFGEYSVSFAAPDAYNDLNEMSGAFVVQTDLTDEPSTHPFTLVAKTVKIGDTSYDWSKAVAYLDGGNIRMSARNEWGEDEKANPLAGQVIPINKDQVITFTFEVKEGAPAPDVPTEAPTEAPAQTYNAYLGFQTDVWDYRDEYEKDFNSKDYDFVNQAMVGGEPTDVSKVKIENATITDNGTYSVSMTGADLSGGTEFKMLFFSTDIPAAMKDVKFSDIKVIIDGTEVVTLKDGVVKKEVQDGSKKYYMIMAINLYGEAGKDLPEEFAYTMPQNSVELQFTVSGLDMGQNYSTKTYGAKKGTTFTSGNFKYKVTTASKITAGKVTKGKAQVVGLSAAGKKKTSVSVPASISYTSNKQKATYTVNTVAAGAFKGASKLKTVTLSKNIKSIKKNTFVNCKNLSKLKLNAKLSSVAKNSFKGCKKTIKVSGKSAKANVTKLKKSGYTKFK